MTRYVGVDAHSKNCVYVIEDESGAVVSQGQVPTTLEGLMLLKSRDELPAGTAVGLETGTMFHSRFEYCPQKLRPPE